MLQGANEKARGILAKVLGFGPVRFVMRVLKKSSVDRVGAYSAQIAFYILMTVFPMVILFLQLIKVAPISQESILYAIDLIFTMLIGVLSISVLYKLLPRRRLRFVAQFPGALFAVVAIMLLTNALSIYVGRFNGFSAYGSLTTLTLVMFWLYFSCYFLMMGAVINEVLQEFGARLSLRWGPARKRVQVADGSKVQP